MATFDHGQQYHLDSRHVILQKLAISIDGLFNFLFLKFILSVDEVSQDVRYEVVEHALSTLTHHACHGFYFFLELDVMFLEILFLESEDILNLFES